jgi:hypothetical protein
MRKVSVRLVAVNPDVTMVLSSRLQAMTEGEMRTRAARVRPEAPFTEAIARRMSTCMPPNYLTALGLAGENNPLLRTRRINLKRRGTLVRRK